MKKLAVVFFLCSASISGIAQCNCSVLFSLSDKYSIDGSDTVGEYSSIKIGNDSNLFAPTIQLHFTDTFRKEYKPIKIPFKVINHSNQPLVFTRVNWGGEQITVNYSKKGALKGDTLTAVYTTLSNLNRYQGPFSKVSTVRTNQCSWMIYFRGIVRHTPKKKTINC